MQKQIQIVSLNETTQSVEMIESNIKNINVKVKNTVLDIIDYLDSQNVNIPRKIKIEGSREKIIHNIEVKYIDEDILREMEYRVASNIATKKERMYVKSMARAIDISRATIYGRQREGLKTVVDNQPTIEFDKKELFKLINYMTDKQILKLCENLESEGVEFPKNPKGVNDLSSNLK